MVRRFQGLLFALLANGAPMGVALAQQSHIAGRVVEAAGAEQKPISTAIVQVPGTSFTATVNSDGRFTLPVPPGTYQVQARALGFAPVTQVAKVTAGAQATVNFVLSRHVVALNEVVTTVSANNARRVEIGTDIERLNAEAVTDQAAVTNLSQLLSARVSGVTVTQSSGTVGSASKIRIRGSSSLTQDNNPLIYVDGIRVSNETGTGPGSFDFGNGQTVSRLDDINPQDIASVQVLKGPTAAALYGSEAAAGVILIETKRGQLGATQFSFSTQLAMMQDVSQYWDNYYNLTKYGGFTDINDPVIQQFRPVRNPASGDIYARNNPMTNPLSSPLRTGRDAVTTLSARGGTPKVDYFGSVSRQDQSGTLPNNTLERYSFRANVTAKPSEKLDITLTSDYTNRNIRLPDNDRSAVGMVTNAGAGQPINARGVNADGSPGDCLATLISNKPSSVCDAHQGNLTANFAKLATIKNTQDVDRAAVGVQLNWRPVGWLSNRLVTGLDFIQTANKNFVPVDPDMPFGVNSRGLINDDRVTHRTLSLNYAATATTHLSRAVATSTTLGAQYFRTEDAAVGCSGSEGFASNTAIACDAALTFTGSSSAVDNVEIGALLQQHFGYNDYLFLTGGVRVDNNSAFGEDEGAIWSPSINFSAILSGMPFWKVNPTLMSDLRLRGAWGTAAQAPSPFAHTQTLAPVRLASPSGQQLTGVSLLDPGNPELTAERDAELEVGLDTRVAKDRIGLKLTYFHQTTTGAIVRTSVAPSTGFSGIRFANIGEIVNSGFETALDAQLLSRNKFVWVAEVRASTQNPKITSLGGQPPVLFGLEAGHQMFRQGFAPGAYYGRVVEHATRDGNGDIIPESIVLAPGNVGDPNAPNDVYLGPSAPSNTQNLSTTLTLGSVQLYTLFDRQGGFVKFDDSNDFRSPFQAERATSRKYAFRKAESTPEEQAMMEHGAEQRNAVFIEDASFVKWREISLTYALPSALTKSWRSVGAATIAVGARNLHTWTKYGGLDPELSYDGGRDSYNTDEFFTAPPSRSFYVRLNMNF